MLRFTVFATLHDFWSRFAKFVYVSVILISVNSSFFNVLTIQCSSEDNDDEPIEIEVPLQDKQVQTQKRLPGRRRITPKNYFQKDLLKDDMTSFFRDLHNARIEGGVDDEYSEDEDEDDDYDFE